MSMLVLNIKQIRLLSNAPFKTIKTLKNID